MQAPDPSAPSTRLVVPAVFNRNAARTRALGAEHTGRILIELVLGKLGLGSLADVDVLDVGCGVRFTQTLLNLELPVRTYTGIDVHKPLIDFLAAEVRDPRFRFAHWDVHNAMYNPGSRLMMRELRALPVAGDFDLLWLFSVFTHLAPEDTRVMLQLLRRCVRPQGRLFFTAFLSPTIEGFVDKDAPQSPLLRAFYGEALMRELIAASGWELLSIDPPAPSRHVQHQILCRPVG